MAEVFGTVTSVISMAQLLCQTYKDLRGRIEKASGNPRLAGELANVLDGLSTRLQLLVEKCENNDVKFQTGYMNTFQYEIDKLMEFIVSAQKKVEEMSEKLNSRLFRFGKAKTTCAWLSQLLSSAEKADRDILTITSCFANAELIAKTAHFGEEKDIYQASFDVEENPSGILLDYGSESDMELDCDAISHLTVEAKLKHAVIRSGGSRSIGAVGRSTGGSLGMAGMSGVGKSCALRGLACDEMIRRRFPDGVYLLVLGKDIEEADVVRKVGRLLKRSGGIEAGKAVLAEMSMEGAAFEAKKWFSSKCILLLIDDIWEKCGAGGNVLRQLERIVDRKSNSGVAFTTREVRVASGRMLIDFAPRNESIARKMILKAAEVEGEVEGDLETVVDEVLNYCGGLPMALSVNGRAIRLRQCVRKCSMVDAWKEQLGMLQKHREYVLREETEDPNYVYKNLSGAFEASLSVLEESMRERIGFDVALSFEEMYRGLIVIRRQSWISIKVVCVLWRIEEVEATEVIQKFAEMSLAERKDVEVNGEKRAGITLHDLQLDFVENRCKELKEEEKWARELLKGWCSEEKVVSRRCGVVCRNWWKDEMFGDEEVRNNVCRLLWKAGLKEELGGLLRSALWIGKRLRMGEVLELEEDFVMVLRNAETNADGRYERGGYVWSLKMIVDAARLCAAYVQRNGREVWFQLYGRLGRLRKESEVIKKFVEEIEEVAERPWVKAANGCLTEPGGRLYRTFICGKGVDWICVSEDGERIVAVSFREEELHRFIFEDGGLGQEDRRDMSDVPKIRAVRCTRGGKRAATVHRDGSMRVWDMENEDGTVKVWDVESGEDVGEPFVGHSYVVRCVSWSGDGTRLASGGEDGTVRVWDVQSGEAVGEPFIGHSDAVRCVSWSVDGTRVASGGEDGTVRVWDVQSGEDVGELSMNNVAWAGEGEIRIRKSLFSEGDEVVEVLASFEGEAKLCQFSDQTFAVGSHGRVFFVEVVE